MSKSFRHRELLTVTGLAILAIFISLYARWEARFPGDLQLTLVAQSIDGKPVLSLMEWVSYLIGS